MRGKTHGKKAGENALQNRSCKWILKLLPKLSSQIREGNIIETQFLSLSLQFILGSIKEIIFFWKSLTLLSKKLEWMTLINTFNLV
jgi:hypothetical protein